MLPARSPPACTNCTRCTGLSFARPPDELSFADPLAIKEIYGQGTPYMKSPFYDGMHVGTPNLFDGRDRAAHKERRKLLSHAFARSSINDAEPLIADQISKCLAWVEKKDGSAMNVYAWFRMLTLDITTCLFMGEAIGALDEDAPHELFFHRQQPSQDLRCEMANAISPAAHILSSSYNDCTAITDWLTLNASASYPIPGLLHDNTTITSTNATNWTPSTTLTNWITNGAGYTPYYWLAPPTAQPGSAVLESPPIP
ncbi:MAG: pisatin demethylase [Lasallia pustulata]|uniref:Pisatin demethylase n=1 Tax=Lasallia pustulata TaxID=136370 RepID=A0A5M8Q1G2_9LECA|nr:MAG: pisatin demethylase [Lasallia pustulata]